MMKSVRVRATGFPSAMSGMRIVLWTLVVFVVVTPEVIEGKIQCYVCDWHLDTSSDNSSSKVVDTCTPHNFQADKAAKVECEGGGCEAKSYKDAKNNAIIHFFRNCVTSSGGHLEDKCFNTEDKANHYYSTCECTSNLCNSSDKIFPFMTLLFSMMFVCFSLAAAPNTFYR